MQFIYIYEKLRVFVFTNVALINDIMGLNDYIPQTYK